MVSGRPKRPAAIAVGKSGTFLWWYREAARDGISQREAQAVERFLLTNHASLEKIDTYELAAGQILTGGSIDRNLRARLNRVDRLCEQYDRPPDPPGKPPPVVHFSIRKRPKKIAPLARATREAHKRSGE